MNYHVTFPNMGLEFDLHTTAFSIGGFSVAWYGVIIACGFLLAIIYALRSCRAMKINADHLLDAVIVGTLAGIVGARLYYVIFYPGDLYIKNPMLIFDITSGGLGIYGGVIAGLGVGALVAKLRKMSVLNVLDLAVLGYLIGQGIGRWGNFVNQEAFGSPTTLPWGMMSENTGGVPVHPCFLYESIWCLLGFVLLHFFTRKLRRYDGQTFLLYLVWYGTGRFFIEGLRTDSLYINLIFTELKVSQLVAVVTVVAALVLLFVFRRRTVLHGCGDPRVMELNAICSELPEQEAQPAVDETYVSILAEEEKEDTTEQTSENESDDAVSQEQEKQDSQE